LEEMKGLAFKNKKAAAFGSYGWSGESVGVVTEKLKEAGFEVVNDGLKGYWNPDAEMVQKCEYFGEQFLK